MRPTRPGDESASDDSFRGPVRARQRATIRAQGRMHEMHRRRLDVLDSTNIASTITHSAPSKRYARGRLPTNLGLNNYSDTNRSATRGPAGARRVRASYGSPRPGGS